MSTSNISVSTAYWSKIVDASDTDFLVTWNVARTVEFATTDLDIAPQLAGHRFSREKIVTREDLGTGYLWARLISDSSVGSMQLSVSKTDSIVGATGGFDSVEGVQKVATLHWNPDLLQWERSTASSGGGSSSEPAVPNTKRFDKQNATTLYVGSAPVGTSEAGTGWAVRKITFDAEGNALAILYSTGTWANRYSLTYT